MSGPMINPPCKEEISIIQLKDRIPDILEQKKYINFKDDFYLLRWLKATHMNVDKGETLIRNALKWRRESHAETLLDQPIPEDFAWNYPFHSDGVDKIGLPVYTLSAGSWDLRHIVESGEKDKFVRYITQMYLKIEENMIKINRDRHSNPDRRWDDELPKFYSTGVVIIVDLKGYSRSQLTSLRTVEAALEIATNYGNYFPEMSERVYLINVSKVFAALFKMIKPLMNLPVIEVFDSNEDHWKKAILSQIEPEQLRPEFGGTKVDPCCITITTCEDSIPDQDE